MCVSRPRYTGTAGRGHKPEDTCGRSLKSCQATRLQGRPLPPPLLTAAPVPEATATRQVHCSSLLPASLSLSTFPTQRTFCTCLFNGSARVSSPHAIPRLDCLLDRPGQRDPRLRNCHQQIGLWALFLVTNGYRQVQPAWVTQSIHRKWASYSMERRTEHQPRSKPGNCSSMVSASSFCLGFLW